METSTWAALTFALVCYGILLVVSLFVAAIIVAVRWATAPRAGVAALGAQAAESPQRAKVRG